MIGRCHGGPIQVGTAGNPTMPLSAAHNLNRGTLARPQIKAWPRRFSITRRHGTRLKATASSGIVTAEHACANFAFISSAKLACVHPPPQHASGTSRAADAVRTHPSMVGRGRTTMPTHAVQVQF
jgi:hypothetical protein